MEEQSQRGNSNLQGDAAGSRKVFGGTSTGDTNKNYFEPMTHQVCLQSTKDSVPQNHRVGGSSARKRTLSIYDPLAGTLWTMEDEIASELLKSHLEPKVAPSSSNTEASGSEKQFRAGNFRSKRMRTSYCSNHQPPMADCVGLHAQNQELQLSQISVNLQHLSLDAGSLADGVRVDPQINLRLPQ